MLTMRVLSDPQETKLNPKADRIFFPFELLRIDENYFVGFGSNYSVEIGSGLS